MVRPPPKTSRQLFEDTYLAIVKEFEHDAWVVRSERKWSGAWYRPGFEVFQPMPDGSETLIGVCYMAYTNGGTQEWYTTTCGGQNWKYLPNNCPPADVVEAFRAYYNTNGGA